MEIITNNENQSELLFIPEEAMIYKAETIK